MRPPLPNGTILQNRYRLIRILGQGGFGRTYLAEDQGRFNELCALKEFTPAQNGEYALEKSKELFQREAQILYQIQHPQIPQFRATFEQDQRLFLVQDYVEGKTYRSLLDERKALGATFSEAEVKQLLRQLLPVLAHIHTKGIIHRDIAPDNIMRRDRDQLPVLIDFGVVKELATRIHQSAFHSLATASQSETARQDTTVGKLGYAPSEQIQTGRAYPSSDLYALAVTAVVLLTGKEPQDLFDDATLTWYWQRWATVTPGFAQVLNRMLSYRPGDRYQSVSEVVRALDAASTVAAPPPPQTPPPQTPPPQTPPPKTQPTVQRQPDPDLSRMATQAVGRRVEPEPTRTRGSQPSIAPRSSMWDDPLAVAAVGFSLVVLTGIGSWAIMRSVLNANNPPSPSPSPTVTFSPSPSPTATLTPRPTPSPSPVARTETLRLVPDRDISRSGTLRTNESITYILAGNRGQGLEQGQQLRVLKSGDQAVLMTVLDPNQVPLGDYYRPISVWQGPLPSSGFYYVRLSLARGTDRGSYQLDVNLQNPLPPEPTPEPSPTPTPTPPPTPEPTPPPTPTPTPEPSPPSPSPTASPTPIETPEPTLTPEPR
jgi:serine/threonine-protein kinase